MKKLRYLSVFIFFMLCFGVSAQLQTKIISGEKTSYRVGDTLQISFFVATQPQTCLAGMDHVKFYKSGVEFIRQSSWKQLKKGLWQKNVSLSVIGNKKGKPTLTIMLKTDKQSFMQQLGFEIGK